MKSGRAQTRVHATKGDRAIGRRADARALTMEWRAGFRGLRVEFAAERKPREGGQRSAAELRRRARSELCELGAAWPRPPAPLAC